MSDGAVIKAGNVIIIALSSAALFANDNWPLGGLGYLWLVLYMLAGGEGKQ
ncbi:hypothetical protein [Serratia marcescens]|uniref:hypothetical protein n=1 Tax=Serratia marcescens TaxID=615 RepID=UPI001BB06D77|nr:hypothetical protein [Serratia marcescens]MBS3892313.1 hypothetical protein [Serratia marcescens]